jgi:hypothetical protein
MLGNAIRDFDPDLRDRFLAYRKENPDYFGGTGLYDYISSIYPHMIPGKLKKLRQAKVKKELQEDAPWFTDASYKALLQVYEDFEDVTVALGELKGKTQKGRKPNPNAKPAYQPPPASTASIKKIQDKVEEVTTQMYESMVDSYKKFFKNMVDRYFARRSKDSESPYSMREFDGGNARIIDKFITKEAEDGSAKYGNNDPYRKRDDFEELLEKAAREQADMVRDRYKSKMMRKLGSIVGKKSEKGVALKDVKVGNLYAYSGTFEGSMYFYFEDGSSFRVMNKVVTKWPMGGKIFHQYPTTFHNVKFANGKTYKMRSQEQMNNEFIDSGDRGK